MASWPARDGRSGFAGDVAPGPSCRQASRQANNPSDTSHAQTPIRLSKKNMPPLLLLAGSHEPWPTRRPVGPAPRAGRSAAPGSCPRRRCCASSPAEAAAAGPAPAGAARAGSPRATPRRGMQDTPRSPAIGGGRAGGREGAASHRMARQGAWGMVSLIPKTKKRSAPGSCLHPDGAPGPPPTLRTSGISSTGMCRQYMCCSWSHESHSSVCASSSSCQHHAHPENGENGLRGVGGGTAVGGRRQSPVAQA